VFVFDTSAYINGRKDHYPPMTFPSVWELVRDAMQDGRIVCPREVYRELVKEDEVAEWIKKHDLSGLFADPDQQTQRAAGEVYKLFPSPGKRDGADPFVIADAQVRGLTVVTYEGRAHTGVPTKRWHRSMPGICGRVNVPCITLAEALALLGGSF
jgi:Domain of unknown function (DUF4411)